MEGSRAFLAKAECSTKWALSSPRQQALNDLLNQQLWFWKCDGKLLERYGFEPLGPRNGNQRSELRFTPSLKV